MTFPADTDTATDTAIIAVRRAIDALSGLDPCELSRLSRREMVDLAGAWEQAARLVHGGQVAVAGRIADEARRELGTGSLAHEYGERTASDLLQRLTGISGHDASRRIRTAALVCPRRALDGSPLPALFPRVGTALGRGEIGLDAAHLIASRLNEVAGRCRIESLDAAERFLVGSAIRDPGPGAAVAEVAAPLAVDLVSGQVRMWVAHLDSNGVAPREEQQREQRALSVGRVRPDGMTRSVLFTPPELTAELLTMLEPFTNPRSGVAFCAEPEPLGDGPDAATTCHDGAAGRGGAGDADGAAEAELFRDPRTPGQRKCDILFGLLRAGSTNTDTPRVQGATATVTAVVTMRDLIDGTGAGWLDDADDPVSIPSIRRMICDGGLAILVIDDDGQPLHLGMTQRNFTTAQRRAMAARDGGCVWPGCTAPPSWCDAHHVLWWSHNGPTDIDNGILLCPYHHNLLQTSDWVIRMLNGRAHLIPPRRLDPSRRPRPLGRSPVAPPMLG